MSIAINQCLSTRIWPPTRLPLPLLSQRVAFDDHPHSHKMTVRPHLATSPSARPPPGIVFPPQTCPSLPHTTTFPHCHMATTLRHPSQSLHPRYWCLARLSLSLRLLPPCTERLREGDGAVFSDLDLFFCRSRKALLVVMEWTWATCEIPQSTYRTLHPAIGPHLALARSLRHTVSTRRRNVVVVPAPFSQKQRIRREKGNRARSRTFSKLSSFVFISVV